MECSKDVQCLHVLKTQVDPNPLPPLCNRTLTSLNIYFQCGLTRHVELIDLRSKTKAKMTTTQIKHPLQEGHDF